MFELGVVWIIKKVYKEILYIHAETMWGSKKLTKEYHVYFYNTNKALEICNDINETNMSRIKYQNIFKN